MFTRYTRQFKIKSYIVYFALAFVTSGIFLLFSFQSLKIRKFVHVQEEYTDILSLRYYFTKHRNLNISEGSNNTKWLNHIVTGVSERINVKAITRENRFTEILSTSGHQTSKKSQTDDVLKSTRQVIGIKIVNGVRKSVTLNNNLLELEQYSVTIPRNNNIVKNVGESDHGKNKAFRKSLRKSIGFQNVPHVYETTNKFNELKRRFQSIRKRNLYNKSLKDSVSVREDSCVNCSKNDFKVILSQENICKTPQKIDILIIISSAPSEYAQRRTIRQTWGSRCNQIDSRIKCVFVIGNFRNASANIDNIRTFPSKVVDDSYNKSQLIKESKDFKDIVQFDFIDSYGNLTYKTLSGLKWAVHVCTSAEYVMKTDTDMFVNTELLPLLVQTAPRTVFMGGFCWGPSFPNRDIFSKWFVSYKSYRHHQFPPMCSGTGYIMSRDVVQLILRKSRNIPFFHLEDVYISLCIQKTAVTPVKLAGFSNLMTKFEDCELYKNNVITSHYMNQEVLYDYWQKLKSCNISISPEDVYRELEFIPLL